MRPEMRRLFRDGLSDFNPWGPLFSEEEDPIIPEEPLGPSKRLETLPLKPDNPDVDGPLLL